MNLSLPPYLLLPLLLLSPSSSSTATLPPPPPPHLPQGVSSFDIESILSLDSLLSFVDESNLSHQNPNKKTTYILCCDHTHPTSTTTTGHSCREKLEPFYGYALTSIYNSFDKSCFYSYNTFISIKDSSISMQPVSPKMKLGLGTWDAVNAMPQPERYDIFLAPGVTESQDEVLDLAWRMVHDMSSSSSAADCKEFYDMMSVAVIDIQSVSLRLLPSSLLLSPPSCSRDMVSKVVTFDEVAIVGYVPSFRPMNVQAQWIVQSDEGGGSTMKEGNKSRPWFEEGLDGHDQIIAVSDTGLDVDNCYFWDGSPHDKNSSLSILDDKRRKVVHYEPYADDNDVREGHGTHVVGTICGRRLVKGEKKESDGDADGVARGAKVAFFDVGLGNSTTLSIPSSPHTLFRPGLSAGASIHTISWGSSHPYAQSTYGPLERAFDQYLYDLTSLDNDENDLLVVVAAGNFGEMKGDDSSGTIVMPAVAKNVLSVGCSQSSGPDLTKEMQGKNYLSDFSSRGPTLDSRLKPELIAPGYFLLSSSSNPTHPGSCDSSNNGIRFDAGTSMSAAVVSGAAALVRQYVVEGYYPGGYKKSGRGWNPSANLVKAVLINGGVDLEGVQENHGLLVTDVRSYDENQGFGRVSLARALPIKSSNDEEETTSRSFDVVLRDRKVIENGGEETLMLYYDDDDDECRQASNGFSATLVYMDPAGVPFCKKCTLNHLTLIVKQNGKKIYANGYEADDDEDNDSDYFIKEDNSQRVRVTNATKDDKFVITVKAKNLVTRDQMYSLVVTGCFRQNDDDEEETDDEMMTTVAL